MRTDNPDHLEWQRVDQSANPTAYVKFLDESRAAQLPMLEKYPEHVFAWMKPWENLQVLDVGSGTGVLLHSLAKFLPNGKVTGIDYSQTMVDEAQRRSDEMGLGIEFKQMDASAMTFADNTFDRAMSNVVFQHLPQTEKSLQEMIRVTKPGGIVSINEQDWETLVYDSGDRALTRRVMALFVDSLTNGWIGRQLYGMFVRAGLKDITVTPMTVRFDQTNFKIVRDFLEGPMANAVKRGQISLEDVDAWFADQDARHAAGTVFAAFTMFHVVGTKP